MLYPVLAVDAPLDGAGTRKLANDLARVRDAPNGTCGARFGASPPPPSKPKKQKPTTASAMMDGRAVATDHM